MCLRKKVSYNVLSKTFLAICLLTLLGCFSKKQLTILNSNYKNSETETGMKVEYTKDSLVSFISYKNGLREGLYIKYYSNSSIMIKGKYKKGEKVGTWQFYFPHGSLERIEKYKKGTCVFRQSYPSNSF